MDKYFICLANSYKRGGRCIAGVEVVIGQDDHWKIVRNNDGSPHWLRPIDRNTEYGEVLEYEARFIPLLSIVELNDVKPCPNMSHSEDINYGQMTTIGMINNNRVILDQFLDNVHNEIFYSTELSISPETYAQGSYSLMMIHPKNIQFQEDPTKDRARYRMSFSYQGANYDFSITDPTFYELIVQQPNIVTTLNDVYITLSIGLVYEGRHHKLIAGFFIPNDTDKNVDYYKIIRQEQLIEKSTCQFSKKELSDYKRAFVVPSKEGMSVCIKKRDGSESFILLDSGSSIEPWQKIDLRKTNIVVYQDAMGKEKKCLRIIETTRPNILKRLLRIFD